MLVWEWKKVEKMSLSANRIGVEVGDDIICE